jgi:hypothetical protein
MKMSYTLYTDAVCARYKSLANNAREKMNILNLVTINYESNSKLAEKYNILATICDNIANRLSDTDYYEALLHVETAMNDVNNTQKSYIRDLYAELNESMAYEP